MYKTILVPLDGSELAEAVLPHVEELAQCAGAEIVLVRVAVNPAFEYAFADPMLARANEENAEAQAGSYLQDMASRFQAAGFKVRSELGAGAVAPTILEIAQKVHPDLIAMSTHGRSGFARVVLGSVADEVLRGSNVPVLLVRP
jgi:nucleotide-binding universal stress UspA family protein